MWDENKATINLEKHGLSFADAHRLFQFALRVAVDDRADYGEERFFGLGLLDGHVVAVVFTEPVPDTIRIISLRKALPQEGRLYEQYLHDELGAG